MMARRRGAAGADAHEAAGSVSRTAPTWEAFVLEHQHPVNLGFHVLSALAFWCCPVAFAISGQVSWGVLWLVSGWIGSLGHWLTGEGDPRPQPSARVLNLATKLAVRVLTGQYHHDLRWARRQRELRS